MAKTFEELRAFQRAMDLTVAVYRATDRFPQAELYGITSQLRRVARSVASHIAEGQGRLTLGEWRQMLSQARGSLFEVEADLIAANRLGFLTDDAAAELRRQLEQAAKPLAGLIAYVVKRERQLPTGNRQRRVAINTPSAK